MSPPGLSGSQGAVEGALDDLLLLLSGQAVEVDRVARDTDGETGIFLRVFHGVLQGGPVHHVHVQVVGPLAEVAVQNGDQVALPLRLILTQGLGDNGEGVGDSWHTFR